MAREAGIDQIALRISEVIHQYADSRGWKKNEYHMFMRFNADLFILNVVLVANALNGRDENQEVRDYDDLWDVIKSKAGDVLKEINYLGLVLRGTDDFGFYPSRRSGSDIIEIDEKLINAGVSWSEQFLPPSPVGQG